MSPVPSPDKYQLWLCRTPLDEEVNVWWSSRQVEKSNRFDPTLSFDEDIRTAMEKLIKVIKDYIRTHNLSTVDQIRMEIQRTYQAPETITENIDVNSPIAKVMDAMIGVYSSMLEGRVFSDENVQFLIQRLKNTDAFRTVGQDLIQVIRGCIEIKIPVQAPQTWKDLKEGFKMPDLHLALALFMKDMIGPALKEWKFEMPDKDFLSQLIELLGNSLKLVCFEVSLPNFPEGYVKNRTVGLSIQIVSREPIPRNYNKLDFPGKQDSGLNVMP